MTAEPDAAAFRTAISHFATGITVVTAASDRGPSGMTANAVCSLSLEPLLMLVCLDLGSRTLQAVRETGRLAVNILAQGQQELAVAFSSKDPEEEKFRGVGYREVGGVPVLEGVIAWLAGDVRELVPGGDHMIAVAGVGACDAPGGEPLVYFRGGYHSLSS